MNMKKKLTFLILLLHTFIVGAQVTKTINVLYEGTLSSLLNTDERTKITNLTLTGFIDVRDVKYMRDSMTVLADINLGSVKINAFFGPNGTSDNPVYLENTLPDRSFLDKITLTNIVLPSSLTAIDLFAFWGCTGLSSITIPNNVTSLGQCAFGHCSGLTSVNIPAGLSSMKYAPFYRCTGLTTFSVDGSNNYYGSHEGVLYNKNLSHLLFCPMGKKGDYSIPAGVTSIEHEAFNECENLTSVTIPVGVKKLEAATFNKCSSLTSVTLPTGLTEIRGSAFASCSMLKTINFPDSLKTIKSGAFLECSSLTSVNLPNSIDSIGESLFRGCTSLQTVNIPYNVTYIGIDVFTFCSNLTSIYAFPIYPVDISGEYSLFNGVNKFTSTLYVPIGSKRYYQVADKWRDFANIVEMDTPATVPSAIDFGIYFYPNPVKDVLSIRGLEGEALFNIIDMQGRSILKGKISSEINVSQLPQGIYFVHIKTNRGTIVRKMLKD